MFRLYILISLLVKLIFSSEQIYGGYGSHNCKSGMQATAAHKAATQQTYQSAMGAVSGPVMMDAYLCQMVPPGNFIFILPNPRQQLQDLPSFIYVPRESRNGNQAVVNYSVISVIQPPEQYFPVNANTILPSTISPNSYVSVPQTSYYRKIDPVFELKSKILASIRGQNIVIIYGRIFHIKNFIYELESNGFSKSLPLELHLDWLFEFLLMNNALEFKENLLEYFDFIKTFYLSGAIKNRQYDQLIEVSIIRLIENRFMMPEIIFGLLKNGFSSVNGQRIIKLFQTFKSALLQFEPTLSKNVIDRMITTLESLLEFMHVPLDVVLMNPSECNLSSMRFILQLAPIYKALLGFEDFNQQKVSWAIDMMNRRADGSYFRTDFLSLCRALNFIYKRAFLRLSQADVSLINSLSVRLQSVSEMILPKVLSTEHFYIIVRDNLFYLSDAFLFYSDMNVDFDVMMIAAYESCKLQTYKYPALKYAQSYLSAYEMKLSTFRENYLEKLLNAGIDKDFILVLEALIAALEDVPNITGGTCYVTWEPNRNFLSLQDQIREIKLNYADKNNRFHVLEYPFLGLAARTFLSRQTGLPTSFADAPFLFEGFSWDEAISFVNFYYNQFSFLFVVKLHVKSQFCDYLIKNFEKTPSLSEMIAIIESIGYMSTSYEIEIESKQEK